MRKWWQNRMLYDKAGDGAGAGGGGTFDALKTGGTGGGSQGDGDNSKQKSGDAGGSGGTSNSGASGGDKNSDWRRTLSTELQENPSLKKFTDVGGLAGAYVSLEKLIGTEKIPVPGQHATDEDWANVFKKLGMPDADKYEVKFAADAKIDKEFVDDFKKNAHKIGILPKQAQKLADWFTTQNKAAEAKLVELRNTELTQTKQDLQQAWGKDFDFELQRTEAFLNKFGDNDLKEFLKKSGFNNNSTVIKFFNKLAKETLGEGKEIEGLDNLGGEQLSPSEALKKANSILGDMKHPYHIKEHANHKAAVQEVQDLYKIAYNQKST